MPKPQIEYKQLPVYIETVDEEQGIVNAVPAVMGNVDYQGDRIWKGAFTKTIQERGAKVRILDNHNAHSTLDVVGRIMSLREIDKAELPPELLMKFPEAIGGLRVKQPGDFLDLEIMVTGAERAHFVALSALCFLGDLLGPRVGHLPVLFNTF